MELTKRFWDEKGYQNLERTAQNLRDKIGHIEKSSQTAAVLIDNEIDEQRLQLINAEEQSEQHTVMSNNNEAQPNINTERTSDTHIPESEYVTNVTPQSTRDENTQQPLHSNIAPEWENLRQKAFVIYTNVKEELGNWKTRKDNTFTKVVPNKTEIKHLEIIAVSLVKEDPANNPENYLWECNCAIYSVATAWKRKDQRNSNDNRHTSNNSQSNLKHRRKPKEVKKMEENMQLRRRELSQLTAEIERIRSNRPLSKKTKRNRRWMEKEGGKKDIGITELAQMKETRLNKIRIQKNEKQRVLLKLERHQVNKLFDENQSKFFKVLRDIPQNDESEEPLYKKPNNRPETSTLRIEDFDNYWRPLWETEAQTNLEADWIQSIEQLIKSKVKPTSSNFRFLTEAFTKCVKKKKNWSSPGNDKICNFWIKNFTSFHTMVCRALNELIQRDAEFPTWLPGPITVMIKKQENPAPQDHRPITCLNNIYKVVTSVINEALKSHEKFQQLLQLDQRGSKPGSMGCIDNLLLDKAILEDAKRNRKNLSCTWIDIQKAYDSVSHNWLIRILEMHGLERTVIKIIEKIVKTWETTIEVTTCNGREKADPISIKRGILQGDSFCVTLFIMSLNPIAWYLRSTEGYSLSSSPMLKITHVLFVDDLKTYHKSESKAAVVSSKLKQMFGDIGLKWGLGKCAAVNIKRGKIGQEQTQMPISHTEFIPLLQNSDHYKFLGKQENATHLEEIVMREASKEYLRRCTVIWSSPLTIPRKIASTNNFAVPAVQYQMWSSMWRMEDIRKLDRDTRKLIKNNKAMHHQESNASLYLQKSKGGKGLMEVESVYKLTKIKVAHYVSLAEDPRLNLVRMADERNHAKKLPSINTTAYNYANELGIRMTLDPVDKVTTITFHGETKIVKLAHPKALNSILKKASSEKTLTEFRNQPWLSNLSVKQENEPNIHQPSLIALNYWRNVPDLVFSVNQAIRQQLVNTKTYQKAKLKYQIENITCRMCNVEQETVPHIMCGCSAIAQSIYKSRHDKMLRPLYHFILNKYGFEESEVNKPWYQQSLPQPVMENQKAKIYWDIHHYVTNCPSNNANKPDIAIFDKENNKWIIIEGTVCYIGKIQERELYKQAKYTELRAEIKRLYKVKEILQINVVFDFLAGYNKTLDENLKDFTGGKQTVKQVIQQCQKWIFSQNCEIVKYFCNA